MNTQTNTIVANDEVFTVTSCRIMRASGYGQYKVRVELIDSNNNKSILRYHSTNSQLFDAANGEDNYDEIVFESMKWQITNSIENYQHLAD
jgi:hypothetical protein